MAEVLIWTRDASKPAGGFDMEVEILKDEKNELQFRLKGETHTVANLLRKELANDSSIEFTGYRVEHPLLNEVIFTIKTSRKDPRKAVKDAISKIQDQFGDFESHFKKA
jgi:DNA-directed RNA polymerase subunit L